VSLRLVLGCVLAGRCTGVVLVGVLALAAVVAPASAAVTSKQHYRNIVLFARTAKPNIPQSCDHCEVLCLTCVIAAFHLRCA
jgi:hypothetical protein